MSKNLKILIVEDETLNLDLMASILTQLGFSKITKSFSGEEAIKLQKENPADIIFLDKNMPGMSGLDVLPLLKEISINTKIIVVSSESTIETVKKFIEIGADGFVVKPFNAKSIINSLKHVANKNKLQL